LGFTKENYTELILQIEQRALEAEAIARKDDEFGVRYRVDLQVRGPNGKEAIVRTGWIVLHGSNVARLATLYVRR
jgi:filamentous hemagglutinin